MRYVGWHYSYAIADGWKIFSDGLWFLGHFFSFKELLKTLFSPWKRMKETYAGGLDLNAAAQAFILNVLMRAVGGVIRLATIILGIITVVLYVLGWAALAVLWICMPIILFALVSASVHSFITYWKL